MDEPEYEGPGLLGSSVVIVYLLVAIVLCILAMFYVALT